MKKVGQKLQNPNNQREKTRQGECEKRYFVIGFK
jgi:hypothetical protein